MALVGSRCSRRVRTFGKDLGIDALLRGALLDEERLGAEDAEPLLKCARKCPRVVHECKADVLAAHLRQYNIPVARMHATQIADGHRDKRGFDQKRDARHNDQRTLRREPVRGPVHARIEEPPRDSPQKIENGKYNRKPYDVEREHEAGKRPEDNERKDRHHYHGQWERWPREVVELFRHVQSLKNTLRGPQRKARDIHKQAILDVIVRARPRDQGGVGRHVGNGRAIVAFRDRGALSDASARRRSGPKSLKLGCPALPQRGRHDVNKTER
eukprot:Amastigsp_a857462_9.p1 type:complete len:271 gc:universal Amastigsp_a857462_9:3-815(+)